MALLLVASVGSILFAASFFVEVRIIVTNPNIGDVTEILRTGWRALLAVATVGSFLLAVYNASTDDTPSDGPASTFEIKGENHDIDVHLHGMDAPDREEQPAQEGNERTDESIESGDDPDGADTGTDVESADEQATE